MKTNSIITTVVFTTTLFATGAVAQTTAQTAGSPVGPTPPPTAIVSLASPMPAPNSIIYIPRLPTPAELSNAAAAQGLAIAKMEQTSDHITVVYQYANGQTNTIAYQLLSAAGMAMAPGAPAPAYTTTVVYPDSGYYYYDPFYYPWGWPWFAPVSLRLGFGYNYGRFGGGHFGGGPGFRHR
jgi:hypothetical protein